MMRLFVRNPHSFSDIRDTKGFIVYITKHVLVCFYLLFKIFYVLGISSLTMSA